MGPGIPIVAIIDDDDGVRRALHRLLRSLNFEPVAFASGEEFLESLSTRRPSCVLMDLHLPGLGGIEVIGRLRDRVRSLPVIAMTGFDQTGTREKCVAAGVADYITKPIEGTLLSAAINRALRWGLM